MQNEQGSKHGVNDVVWHGLGWLVGVFGYEWLKKVDPGKIDMASTNSDVLATASGQSYYGALRTLGLRGSDAKQLGFEHSENESWAKLTKQWREAIKALRE